MGPKRKEHRSPAQAVAKKLKARSSRKSPGKSDRVKRALNLVGKEKVQKTDAVTSMPNQPSGTTSTSPDIVSDKPICIQNCVIKGYHHYKIRSPLTDPPTRLLVDKEYSNIHDENSCLVWIPELDHFDKQLHNIVTDDKRLLILSDIAGFSMGHVPRELAPCFRTVLDAGGCVYAEAFGEPTPSTYPWPEQHEVGGGVFLPL